MAYSVRDEVKKRQGGGYSVRDALNQKKQEEEQATRDNALGQFLEGLRSKKEESADSALSSPATVSKNATVAPLSGGKKFQATDIVGKNQLGGENPYQKMVQEVGRSMNANGGMDALLKAVAAQEAQEQSELERKIGRAEQNLQNSRQDVLGAMTDEYLAASRGRGFGFLTDPTKRTEEAAGAYQKDVQDLLDIYADARLQSRADLAKAEAEQEMQMRIAADEARKPNGFTDMWEDSVVALDEYDWSGSDPAHILPYLMGETAQGAAGQVWNLYGGLATTAGDALTGGQASDSAHKIQVYLTENPQAYEQLKAVAVNYPEARGPVQAQIAKAAGVSAGDVEMFRQMNLANMERETMQNGMDVSEGVREVLGNLAYTTGQQIPSMLLTSGGGNKALAEVISRSLMGAGSAGSKLQENAKKYGFDLGNYASAVATGIVEAATEAMGNTPTIASILSKPFAEASFGEMMEEFIGYPLGQIADWLSLKDGIRSGQEFSEIFDLNEWFSSSMSGLALGSMMGSVGAVASIAGRAMEGKATVAQVVTDANKVAAMLPEDLRPKALNPNTATAKQLKDYLSQVMEANLALAERTKAQPKKGAEVATEMGIGKHGAEAAEKAGITPGNVGAFTVNYEAGKDGKAFEEVKTVQTGIDENVARQAYNAGQMDAIAEGTAEQEVTENGERAEEIRLRGSGERLYGQNSGGQDQRLVGGTAETERGDGEGGPADRGAAALVTSGKAVTTGSLGIAGGSNIDAVQLVTGGETEATKEAYALAKKRGLRLQLFVGGNLHINGEEARAYISGDRVFVRADHPEYTADQLMIHEETHDMENKGELDVEKVLERLRDTYTEEELDSLAEIYAEVFLNDGKTADEIWIEIIGDSRANMNAFAGTEIEEEFAGLMQDARAAVEETKGEATKAPTNEGRASVETLPDGRKYVKADRQVLFGSDPESWSEQLEDYINGKIRRGEDVRLIAEDGRELLLTSRTAGKVSSIYQNDRTMSESAIERKFHAGAHIDELAEVSVRKQRPKKDRDGKHGSEASGGWEYRKAFFLDFDGKYYECTISAEIAENGITVYNIGQMQERSFPHVQNALNGSSVDDGAQRGKTSSTNRVFQSDPKVKKDSSATSREISKEAAAKAVERVRARDEKRIAALKANFKAREERARESRNAVQMREKIQNHTKKISKELLRPNDKHHIPEELRGPVAKVLESINNASAFDVEFTKDADYKRVPRGESRYAEATKRTKAFAELKAAYSKIAGELVVDPDLFGADGVPGLFDQIAEMSDKSLSEMNTEELTTVWQAVRAMEASIRSANKLFAKSKFASISEAAYALRNDNAHKAVRKELKGIFGTAQNLTTLDMMTPETFLHEMGQSGEAIFRTLRDAEDKQTEILKTIADFSTKLTQKVDVRKLEAQTVDVTLGGKQVTMSTAQLMELYALSHRQQAADHIFKGGILPEELKRGKGERTIEPVQGITPQELAKAFENLTEAQKHIADEMQRFASKELSDYGNEASLQVYNYKKFTEDNYWPIRSNQNEIRSSVERDTQTTSVANKGFTKTVKPHANTSLKIGSIFDTFANHSTEMAKYAAWLGATEDVNRIRNFTFRDGQGNRVGTVKGLIERVHGAKGAAYLQKLLADIANGIKPVEGEIGGKLTGNVKAAAVGGNMRVVIQQPTAILRAASMINPKYFVGAPSKGGWQKALKYAPIAQWKNWGYYDINTGRQIKDVLFNSDTNLSKAREITMKGAEVADSAAWGWLWNTVEREIAATNKELKKGSDEFYQAVAKRFTEVVDRTQLVDSILHRSQIMRSPSGLTKMATSFMGEPTKQYNMMLMASYDLRRAKDADARKRARSQFAKTTAAMAVSGVVNAAVQSIVDAIRDDDREKEYWEKWLSAFVGTEGDEEGFMETAKAIMGGNAASAFNPAQYVPYAKDVVSLLQGYDVSRMDMDGVEKAISAANNLWKAIRGDGKHTIGGATINFIAEASRVLGVPVENIKRDVLAIAKTAVNASDNYLAQYHLEKALTNFNYSGGTKIALDILYDAYEKNDAAYEIILDDMIGSGVERDKIRTNMEDRMKKAQGVKKVSELEQRYLFPDEQEDYDRTVKQLKRSDAWKQASSKQKAKVQDQVYDLTVQNADGEDLMEKIQPGKQYGLTETEYLLYKLALEVVDKPTDKGKYGTFTNDEVEEAIKMIGLSKEESAYLWDAAGKSDKSNPWK